jgi:hypothetical protein
MDLIGCFYELEASVMQAATRSVIASSASNDLSASKDVVVLDAGGRPARSQAAR